jgi:hypothetical protein
MLSADLSGTGNASGHPEYMSINGIIYLFPDNDVEYGPDKSNPTLAKGNGGMSVSWRGGRVFLLFRV